jgi:hypothetical protein
MATPLPSALGARPVSGDVATLTDAALIGADLGPVERAVWHLSGPWSATGPAPCLACGRIDCTTPDLCGLRLSVTVLAVCPTCRGRRATPHGGGWHACGDCDGQGLYVPDTRDVGTTDPVLMVTPRPPAD